MKTFFQEYGLATTMAVCALTVVMMATPVGSAVAEGMDSAVNGVGPDSEHMQVLNDKADKSMKVLAGEDTKEYAYYSTMKKLLADAGKNTTSNADSNSTDAVWGLAIENDGYYVKLLKDTDLDCKLNTEYNDKWIGGDTTFNINLNKKTLTLLGNNYIVTGDNMVLENGNLNASSTYFDFAGKGNPWGAQVKTGIIVKNVDMKGGDVGSDAIVDFENCNLDCKPLYSAYGKLLDNTKYNGGATVRAENCYIRAGFFCSDISLKNCTIDGLLDMTLSKTTEVDITNCSFTYNSRTLIKITASAAPKKFIFNGNTITNNTTLEGSSYRGVIRPVTGIEIIDSELNNNTWVEEVTN